jgi:hypothetical protein
MGRGGSEKARVEHTRLSSRSPLIRAVFVADSDTRAVCVYEVREDSRRRIQLNVSVENISKTQFYCYISML